MAAVRSFPRRYRALLVAPGSDDGPDAVFRRRPDPLTWSALEYTAHVADKLDLLGPAVRRVLADEETALPPFDNDERAAAKRYDELERTEVLGWLELACGELATVIEAVRADDWANARALAMVRDGVHEGSHHLRDVERVLARVRGRHA